MIDDTPQSFPVTRSDVVYEGAVWRVRRDVIDYPSGEITRDYVDHPGAACVVALDTEGNVVAEIDLMQTAIVRYDDVMTIRVRWHPWAYKVAKTVHEHASVEEENYEGEKPVKKTVDAEGWTCRYKVQVDWR